MSRFMTHLQPTFSVGASADSAGPGERPVAGANFQVPVPEQFTTADSIMLARLQQAMSQARQSLDDGDIDEQAHGQLEQMIQGRLGPLQQRQQASQQQQQQQQQQMEMSQHAHQQAMEQQAAEYRAKGLHARLVPVTDLNTGRIAQMYEQKPGHWAELKFEAHPEPQAPKSEAPAK